MPAISQLTPVAASVPGSLAAPTTSTTRKLTIVSPATHPNAKPDPTPACSGAVEHQDDRDDGDGTQSNGGRSWQQLSDHVAEHGRSLPAPPHPGSDAALSQTRRPLTQS